LQFRFEFEFEFEFKFEFKVEFGGVLRRRVSWRL